MDRRSVSRQARRLQVRLKPKGTAKVLRGFTTNISDSGTYVTTHGLLPKGTRVLLELRKDHRNVLLEAEVVRSQKSFHNLQPSGMGLRFLDVSELVHEMLPAETEGTEISAGTRLYRLTFPDRNQLIVAYEQDLETGGLFIPTAEPPQLGTSVRVEIAIAEMPNAGTVTLDAKVVHRLLPADASDPAVVGMGVELSSFERAKQAVEELLVRARPGSA